MKEMFNIIYMLPFNNIKTLVRKKLKSRKHNNAWEFIYFLALCIRLNVTIIIIMRSKHNSVNGIKKD